MISGHFGTIEQADIGRAFAAEFLDGTFSKGTVGAAWQKG
jgi:hypothetical protein